MTGMLIDLFIVTGGLSAGGVLGIILAIVAVIILVVLLVVFARAKGLLCFKGESIMPDFLWFAYY
jgi:predicted PurR-regulated permease PerM